MKILNKHAHMKLKDQEITNQERLTLSCIIMETAENYRKYPNLVHTLI